MTEVKKRGRPPEVRLARSFKSKPCPHCEEGKRALLEICIACGRRLNP